MRQALEEENQVLEEENKVMKKTMSEAEEAIDELVGAVDKEKQVAEPWSLNRAFNRALIAP